MACSTLLGVCLIASVLATGLGASVTLEADDFAQDFDANRTIDRANAGNKKNLHLYTGESVVIKFCLDFDDTIKVEEFYYSNDGAADMYLFELDGNIIGNVNSSSNTNAGKNWNEIEESGQVGDKIDLSSGEHTLNITIVPVDPTKVDVYGTEIDSVVIEFEEAANGDLSCVAASSTGSSDGTTSNTEGTTDTEETTTGASTEGTTYCEGEDC